MIVFKIDRQVDVRVNLLHDEAQLGKSGICKI